MIDKLKERISNLHSEAGRIEGNINSLREQRKLHTTTLAKHGVPIETAQEWIEKRKEDIAKLEEEITECVGLAERTILSIDRKLKGELE